MLAPRERRHRRRSRGAPSAALTRRTPVVTRSAALTRRTPVVTDQRRSCAALRSDHVLQLEEDVVAIAQQADAGAALEGAGVQVAVAEREAERIADQRDLRLRDDGAAPVVEDAERR